MPFQQPAGMTNDKGVIMTIGFVANGESFQIVLPCSTDSTAIDEDSICEDCVESYIGSDIGDMAAIIASDAYVSFVAGEGMTNGRIPYRHSFDPTAYVGTRTGLSAPTNVCGIAVYYCDPADLLTDARMKTAKTFFSGLSKTDLIENQIVEALYTLIFSAASDLQGGFASLVDPGKNWYRVLAAPKTRTAGQTLQRAISPISRTGIYTQRRRLVPRAS